MHMIQCIFVGEVDAYHREWRDKTKDWKDAHHGGSRLDFNNHERRGLREGERPPARHAERPRQAAIEYQPEDQKQSHSRKPRHASKN